MERGQRLEVDLYAGDVDVKTWSRNAVRVAADPGGQGKRFPVAATALAALAWLDFRDQDVHGLFDPYLGRALAWLGKVQRADGSFYVGGQPPPPQSLMYESSIAIMALGQAAASTGAPEIRAAATKGILWLERSQAHGGGFRYGPNAMIADLSVTAWAAQAMEAARETILVTLYQRGILAPRPRAPRRRPPGWCHRAAWPASASRC